MSPSPSINPKRLLNDLRELATVGKRSTGVCRPAYSTSDIEARKWLLRKYEEAGLAAQIDRLGNVFGRSRGVERAVLVGSHTDSVPTGGWLDGSLGVIYGLEIARVLSSRQGAVGVDTVSFADEEGTFTGLFGSRTFCREIDDAIWPTLKDMTGRTLPEALEPFVDEPRVLLDTSRTVGYLEAHIEQGPKLEALRRPIGIVTSIVGIRTRRLMFRGRADHAGSTPMNMRDDAGWKAISLAHRVTERFKSTASQDTVWNFGNIILRPGAANVVPAEGELFVQYRDADPNILSDFDAILAEEVGRANNLDPGSCTVFEIMTTEPVRLSSTMQQTLREAAEHCNFDHIDIPSGAGHDAGVLAQYVPAAMVFIPSKGGRSHTFDEDTDEADIIAGAVVLYAAVERLLNLNN
jgi:beta-ureidopropionase / N-carbamoyl-L-amino-acid hydrolase